MERVPELPPGRHCQFTLGQFTLGQFTLGLFLSSQGEAGEGRKGDPWQRKAESRDG